MTTQHGPAALPRIPAEVWKIAAVCGVGAFMAMLDATVANLAIESIRVDFDSTLPLVQWVATGYLIALAVSLPATGWLGSRFGYGRVWRAALALFVVASALCALAPSPITLIAGRFLKGLAAGLMVPSGQAIIGSTANPRQFGRLMGILGLVVSLGPAVGPAVGGFLLEIASWRWLFWINVPIGAAALIAARGLVPTGVTTNARPLDRVGLALIAIGLPMLLFGATEIGAVDETPGARPATGSVALPLLCAATGATMVVVFVFLALRSAHPLINLRLFRRGSFSAAVIAGGCNGANMYGGLLLLPLYLQLVVGMDQAHAGLMLLAMGLGSAVALPIAGMLADRFGPGPISIVGALILIGSTIPFLLPHVASGAVLVLIFITRGSGMALAQMPAFTAAYGSVSPEEMGDASTLVNIMQRVGGAIGAIAVVIVLAQSGGQMEPTAYRWAFALTFVFSLMTLVAATFLRRYTRRR